MNSYLRSLSFEWQIQLLFAVLVLLLIVLTWLMKLLLKTKDASAEMDNGEIQRHELYYLSIIKSSWIILGIFWLGFISGANVSTLLYATLSFWLLREFITMAPTTSADHYSLSLAFFVILPGQYFFAWQGNILLLMIFIPVLAFIIIPFINMLSGEINTFAARVEKIQMGLMTCVFGFSHLSALFNLQIPFASQGQLLFLPVFLFLVVQINLICQYLLQRLAPLKASLPNISSSFNWKYAFIGVLVGAIVGELLSAFTPFKPGNATALAIISCMVANAGNLLLKAYKHSYGISAWKLTAFDSSSALLDKIGTLCFAAPMFFYSIVFYFDYKIAG